MKKTDQIATEEEREMINMVQEFESMMVEDEDAGDSDAEDEEQFEIEVLFEFTKFVKQDRSGQYVVVDKEYNEVFSVNNVLFIIQ